MEERVTMTHMYHLRRSFVLVRSVTGVKNDFGRVGVSICGAD